MISRKIRLLIVCLVLCCCNVHAQQKLTKYDRNNVLVRGWNILTDNSQEIDSVINATGRYDINHLQLSHSLIMDLCQMKDPHKQKQINGLIEKAHNSHIKEVTLWDHALY